MRRRRGCNVDALQEDDASTAEIIENGLFASSRVAGRRRYEVLSDVGARRLYDGCLVAREKLVRKNLYKYAVANSPEFRDVVDEQFREAVLDPEEDVQGDALVLCCESCGAPSKFRCSICDRLVCAFCQLKQHAFDGVPPHYPSKYSPRYRRQLESDGRKMRLLKNQQEHHDRPWCKGGSTRATDERKFKQLSRKVGDEAIAGADAAHARLALTYYPPERNSERRSPLWTAGLGLRTSSALRINASAKRRGGVAAAPSRAGRGPAAGCHVDIPRARSTSQAVAVERRRGEKKTMDERRFLSQVRLGPVARRGPHRGLGARRPGAGPPAERQIEALQDDGAASKPAYGFKTTSQTAARSIEHGIT